MTWAKGNSAQAGGGGQFGDLVLPRGSHAAAQKSLSSSEHLLPGSEETRTGMFD